MKCFLYIDQDSEYINRLEISLNSEILVLGFIIENIELSLYLLFSNSQVSNSFLSSPSFTQSPDKRSERIFCS